MVWYTIKQKINYGPNFPSSFLDEYVNEFCTVSLNRTHLMLIHSQSVFIIDFMQENWIPLPTLKWDFMYNCKGASGFDKNGNQYV